MELPESATSPFRQKIFSLMNQQQPSKILKLSHKIHNKTLNSLSPLKDYSIDTDMADSHKINALDSSSGILHFKSLQQKLGLRNLSNEKSRGKQSSSKSSGKRNRNLIENQKKVSFVQSSPKYYLKSSKSKSKSRPKHSLKKPVSKGNISLKVAHSTSPKFKPISKNSSNKSLSKPHSNKKYSQTLTEQSKKHFQSTSQYLESGDKETQKKNYLLQTLKKMQSVRKNLTKTFQQFDQEQNLSNEEKQKSKSNLTVISDFVNEESSSTKSYGIRNGYPQMKKSKSKTRLDESTKKSSAQKNHASDIFHKKTPSKNRYLTSQESLSENTEHLHAQMIPKPLLKQVIVSCKHPQKWQTLLANDLISILFRIVKKKLIEIEIHAEHEINCLEIQLEKGSLLCQSLKEKYEGVRQKEIMSLLCSVRGINAGVDGQGLFQLPKLLVKIEAKLSEGNSVTFKKSVDLPYTWLMLIEKEKREKSKCSSSKKHSDASILDRVRTRSTLQNIELSKTQKRPNILEILQFCEVKAQKEKSPKRQKKNVNKSTSKLLSGSSVHKVFEQGMFLYGFELEEQEFRLAVKLNQTLKNGSKRHSYDLELQGKGQALMGKMLVFLELLS